MPCKVLVCKGYALNEARFHYQRERGEQIGEERSGRAIRKCGRISCYTAILRSVAPRDGGKQVYG